MLVLTKDELYESSTEYAQGGIAAALGEDDEVGLHLHDTLRAGDGLCREKAVQILVSEGPQQIEQLIAWGMRFDRNGTSWPLRARGRTAVRASCMRMAIPPAVKSCAP